MEDNFRLSHAKLLNRAEEISFYHANQREKENINANFTQMFKNTFNILRLRAIVNGTFLLIIYYIYYFSFILLLLYYYFYFYFYLLFIIVCAFR